MKNGSTNDSGRFAEDSPIPPPPSPPGEGAGGRGLNIGETEGKGNDSSVLSALFGIDLRALAILRIGMGLLIVFDFIGRTLDLDAHYTEWGVLPHLALIDRNGDYWAYLSPYMWTGFFPLHIEHVLVGTLFFISGLCAFLMAIGWKTRWTTIATWMLFCAVHIRNPLILHGADETLRALLFWTMFVPWGSRFSWDALRAKRSAYGIATPNKVLSVGTAALLLQIGLIYWFTAALKSGPEWRQTGLAVYYALSIEQYATPVGQFLRQYHGLLKPMTFGAIALEALGPTLVFIPFATEKIRAWVAPLFMLFHLVMLNLLFDLGPFPYIASLMWVIFVPPFVWDAIARKWNASVRVNPALTPVEKGRIALIEWRNARVAAYCRKQKPIPSLGLHTVHQMVCAFFLLFVFLWNLRGMDYNRWVKVMSPQWNVVTKLTRIDQGWGLFAPRPMSDDGWYVMPSTLQNGTKIDVFTAQSITWSKPAGGISGMYRSERWRKYLMNLWPKSNADQRYYYFRYQCRSWNLAHDAAHQLRDMSLYYMLKETQPDYSERKPAPIILYSGACTADDAPGGSANPAR